MKIMIQLEGAQALERLLRQKSEQDFVVVCKKTTTILRRQAAINTPVRKCREGGGLRRSLRAEIPAASRAGVVGYTREYAPHVEYGHRTVNGGWVNGQYFLKSAVDTARTDFIRLCREELKK